MQIIQAAFNNYRTTLAGIGLAVLNVYANGGYNNMTQAQVWQSIALVVLGVLAKDGVVSGAPKIQIGTVLRQDTQPLKA